MEYSNIKIPKELHKKLLEIQADWQKQEGRRVTIIEVIGKLVKRSR